MKNKKVPLPFMLVLAALLLGLISSCTQYKNTFIHRGYHNMTSRYNVYFYARESLKEGVRKLEKANKDDYTKILPVFIYGDDQSAKTINPEMDRVVKKASMCITRHTIKDKRTKREIVGAVRWIDNAWNVLGKAQFYKREFFSGVETFEYVANTYKSKERYEAWLWLLKTYNAMNLLSAADPYISKIKNEKSFPKEFKDEFAALYAEFYIKQGLYEEATKQMEEAIFLTKNKQTKARYNFILGQLHEQNHNNQKAIYHFNKAISLKPEYDMVFNAKIKRALLTEPTPENIRRIKHELKKMIPDIKN
ncbi:MAG: tetratricopeptide repeat protein, partial [Bacteroidia bacterium]